MKRHRKGEDTRTTDNISPNTHQNPVSRSSNGSMLSFMMQSANLSGLFSPSTSDLSSDGSGTKPESPRDRNLEKNSVQEKGSGTHQNLISSSSALGAQPDPTSSDSFGPVIDSVWTRHAPQTLERNTEAIKKYGPPLTWDYSEDVSNGYRISEQNEGRAQWAKAPFDGSFGRDKPHPPPPISPLSMDRFVTASPPMTAWSTRFDFQLLENKEKTIPAMPTASNATNTNRKDTTWTQSSPSHRPGYSNKIPSIPNGIAIYDTGSQEIIQSNGAWVEDRSKGVRADLFDKDGLIVGEWKDDGWRSHGRLGQYFWASAKQGDRKKPQSDSGRGSMAATTNKKDQKNAGSKTVSRLSEAEGPAFSNGVEKLSHYFERGSDGIIRGPEMSDLALWEHDKTNSTSEEDFQNLKSNEPADIRIPVAGIMPSTSTPFI